MNKRNRQRRGEDHLPSLTELLTTPVNSKKTRRILEFCSPLALFVEVDEQGAYHIIGVPGIPGHFQLGTLVKQKEWIPAREQEFLWQARQEQQGGYLHYVERQMTNTDELVALVQHQPTYVRRGKDQVLQDIRRVVITPLWEGAHPPVVRLAASKRQNTRARTTTPSHKGWHSYHGVMNQPCSCDIYQSLEQTYAYQWSKR